MDIQIIKQHFKDIPQFSSRDADYVTENPKLRPFYKYEVNIDAFEKVINDKSKTNTPRSVLVESLKEQYASFDQSDAVERNIDLLASENTFTITTAHQPSLFTGPLYYIYKIITTLNLTKELKSRYPNYNFVPVFVSGAEDHDFEEINHLNIFGKQIQWENTEKGACGLMKTESLENVLNDLKTIMGDSEHATKLFDVIAKTHTKNGLYGDAALELTHELFKQDGLVVLNMNKAKLKEVFIPIIKDEILNEVSYPLVNKEIDKIENDGYKAQARPREINFFYLIDQVRALILNEDDIFKVKGTDIQFTKEAMIAEIESHPERFSPNVIMRPLYQELVLPNLAYVGGGGELAYWMERQPQFEYFGINFPMLFRRNSAMWVPSGMSKKLQKLNISLEESFYINDQFIKSFVNKNSENEISIVSEKENIQEIISNLSKKAANIDSSLEAFVIGSAKSIEKTLDKIEQRMIKSEKSKMDVQIKQIDSIKHKLYPKNGLQERHDNFIEFYIKYGNKYFDILKDAFQPFSREMIIIQQQA